MARFHVSLLLLLLIGVARADSAVGDWGHFLSYDPVVYLYNPEGEAFDVRVNKMRWAVPHWNPASIPVTISDPNGNVLVEGEQDLDAAHGATLRLPAGAKGVYKLEGKISWMHTTLDRSVWWTGKTTGHMVEDQRACFQAAVPRRWWFFVPDGVTEFTAKAQRADRYMSQREDWGFFIISPRGQRIRAIWGQPPHTSRREYRQEQVAKVEVEPGAGGRFWCLEVQLGDSHVYSNINIAFDGVPPYIARSPEEWFNPETGELAAVKIYDVEPFIQSARLPNMEQEWPYLQHFSPVPSLGDPDSIEVLGDARFALWNPEGRELGFRIGTYLPRRATKDDPLPSAEVTISGANGRTILDKAMELHHIHGKDGHPTEQLQTGKGVVGVRVAGAERFLSFTYPATPLVLQAREANGWQRFRFTAAAPRNWYFRVPEGAESFDLRVACDREASVVQMEICSPDRTVDLIYGNTGQASIRVPEGMDGKIWYLRPSIGGATRIEYHPGEAIPYQDLSLTVDLRGVPGLLAPSWEQWFNPADPKHPHHR